MTNDICKVSVVVMTYYHEKYIRQALDSILSQNIAFKYEILVGDDASGDNTPLILKEYAENNPDVFRLALRQKNVGATRNMAHLLSHAKGEYIAFLEGDDYWIDINKLKKQVDFLDANRNFIGCSHKCVVVDENNIPDYEKSPHWVKYKRIFKLSDFVQGELCPGQLATLVFRNSIKNWSPIARIHPHVGDKTLMLMLLARGNFYVFNDVMSAYRFVINKDSAKNWFSILHSERYWQYDLFMRTVRLGAYARSLGIKNYVGSKRDEHYISLLDDIIKGPELKRLKQLSEMTVKSRESLRYINLAIKYLISRKGSV